MGSLSWYAAILANFLAMACHMSATLLSVYWKSNGFLDGQIGWLAAGFSTAAILSRLGLGRGLETKGRKPFMVVGAILLTLMPLSYFQLADSYPAWVLVRLLQGAGLGCYITAILTWVADISPPDKIGQLQGVFGISGLVGAAVGPAFLEWVYLQHGFPAMFAGLSTLGVVCCGIILWLPESHPKEARPEGHSPSSIKIWEHRAVLVMTLPFGWFVGTLIAFIGPYLESIDLPRVGLFFTGFAAASVAVRIFASRAIDQMRIERLNALSGGALLLSALTLAALVHRPEVWVLLSAAVLNGLGHGFLFPGLSSHIVKTSAPDQRGAGLALFTGTFDLGILVGSLASGYLSQAIGYSTTFQVSALLLFLGIPLFSLLNTPSKPSYD